MVRKRFQDAKIGLELAKSFNAQKYLKNMGLGKEDYHFWKQPRPKEEKKLAHLYECRKFSYPGDEEATREFVEKGGMIGTTIGPKGVVETDKDSYNYQKQLQDKKFEQEALKLLLRMKNEVISELQDKGYNVK
ncbi:hypothetical protein LguiB_031107 [Lonicera macranthoides]